MQDLQAADAPKSISLADADSSMGDLYSYRWAAADVWRPHLIEAIEARQRSDIGLARSNRAHGWHSKINLPSWPEPAVAALIRHIVASADDLVARLNGTDAGWRTLPWVMDGWANVNPSGGARNALHDHVGRNWHLSGCHYVRCPQELASIGSNSGERGRIVFEERWSGLRLRSTEPGYRPPARLAYAPTDGETLFFPSWRQHRVEAHHATSTRISIAFNLHSPQLERSRYWTYRHGVVQRRIPALFQRIGHFFGRRPHSPDGRPPGIEVG
jgi:uncharacterized protein (TIGR02466 family)